VALNKEYDAKQHGCHGHPVGGEGAGRPYGALPAQGARHGPGQGCLELQDARAWQARPVYAGRGSLAIVSRPPVLLAFAPLVFGHMPKDLLDMGTTASPRRTSAPTRGLYQASPGGTFWRTGTSCRNPSSGEIKTPKRSWQHVGTARRSRSRWPTRRDTASANRSWCRRVL
jgi:hypothetical protein